MIFIHNRNESLIVVVVVSCCCCYCPVVANDEWLNYVA
jgi:hypothetical protein